LLLGCPHPRLRDLAGVLIENTLNFIAQIFVGCPGRGRRGVTAACVFNARPKNKCPTNVAKTLWGDFSHAFPLFAQVFKGQREDQGEKSGSGAWGMESARGTQPGKLFAYKL